MKTTSMSLRLIASLFMATSEVAPQSISALILSPTRWKQVLNRPPEPKASPQPTNCRCMECPQEARDNNSWFVPGRRSATTALDSVALRRAEIRDEHHKARPWPGNPNVPSTPCLSVVFFTFTAFIRRLVVMPRKPLAWSLAQCRTVRHDRNINWRMLYLRRLEV